MNAITVKPNWCVAPDTPAIKQRQASSANTIENAMFTLHIFRLVLDIHYAILRGVACLL